MAEVVLKAVCKTYDQTSQAVKDFNLVIRDGEFLVLVGPSGCGKSTTLRMIAGLEEITSGTIAIGGTCVNHMPPKDRDIAMVFQNYALYPHMNVYDNMAFGLKLRGVARSVIKERVTEAAEILEIQGLLKRLPKQLSGGQRQRVAVGRAIVRQPKVFLFDEPLSNLDARMRVEMRGELTRLHQRLRATMVYVTHDQVEAMTMGDRIVVMHQGEIQQVAPPLAVYQRPANLFVASFIGNPAMNRLRGRLCRRAGTWCFEHGGGIWTLPAHLAAEVALGEGQAVWLGFRPEAFDGSDSVNHVCGLVDLVEPMGAETFVHLLLPCGTKITARVHVMSQIKMGSELSLPLNLAHARLFDVTSERALTANEE